MRECEVGRNRADAGALESRHLTDALVQVLADATLFPSRRSMRHQAAQSRNVPAAKADGKIRSAREAVGLIRSGDTIATSGFVGIGFAEAIAIALERRVLDSSSENSSGEATR